VQPPDICLVAVDECLRVVAARGVDLRRYADARLYHPTSAVRRELARLAFRALFRFSQSARRTSAHVLADPVETQRHTGR
jgi:hypothetical protein